MEKTLIEDTQVRRYDERKQLDSLPDGEDSFTASSFRYVECWPVPVK
ncbi:MAG TPA: hypothetical protein VN682_00520 [Terriglobales bacterium]|nr:hypothetical protein [Terriglobales bacterium]